MVDHYFIPEPDAVERPTITITHNGEGFELVSSWGTTIRTMVVEEEIWGRIVCYYETKPKDADPSIKFIPKNIPVINLEHSPPLVPKGAKLVRFPSLGDEGPRLWTLYFPPLAPANRNPAGEARGDLAAERWAAPINDSFFEAFAQAIAQAKPAEHGDATSDSVRRDLVEFMSKEENRRRMPEATDESWERTWQNATRGGTLPGVKHWRDGNSSGEVGSTSKSGGQGQSSKAKATPNDHKDSAGATTKQGKASQLGSESEASQTADEASTVHEDDEMSTVKGDDDMQEA